MSIVCLIYRLKSITFILLTRFFAVSLLAGPISIELVDAVLSFPYGVIPNQLGPSLYGAIVTV